MIEIKDFPNYSITKDGRVFNNKRNKELAQFVAHGYKYVTLFNKNVKQNKRINILMYQAYNGDIKPGFVIDHVNRIKTDNSTDNLRQVKQIINLHNQNPISINNSGITGIQIKSGNYKSSICINYNVHTKYFPLTERGKYQAIMYRVHKKIEYGLI